MKNENVEEKMDILPVGVFFLNEEGRVIYANSEFIRNIGKEKSNVFGKNWTDFLSDEIQKNFIENWKEIIIKEKEISLEIMKDVSKEENSIKWYLLKIVKSNDEDKGYIGSTTDITSLKRKEESIEQARKDAENATAVKSTFLASMSHEIRTPINGIFGMLQLFQLSNLSKDQREYFDLLKISVESVLKIADDILDISKIEAGKIELEYNYFNIRKTMADIIDIFSLTAFRKEIGLYVKVEEDIPELIFGDVIRIRQIITNLIGNAIKFTEKGEIFLFVRKIEENDINLKLCFEIMDTGMGIPKEKIGIIFDSFEQGDISLSKKLQGVGLGLAIAKKLTEIMYGTIEVESEYKKGTIFRVVLDFVKDKEKPNREMVENKEQALEMQNEENVVKGSKVLLIEDNNINRLIMREMLKLEGFIVDEAEDGYKALDLLKRNKYNYILLDIQMPELSGYDIARIIRKGEKMSGDYTPIIAVTALAMEKDKEKCFQEEMDAFISKPFSIADLIKVFKNLKNKNRESA